MTVTKFIKHKQYITIELLSCQELGFMLYFMVPSASLDNRKFSRENFLNSAEVNSISHFFFEKNTDLIEGVNRLRRNGNMNGCMPRG